jgi:uncharacterized membrane-anchored protein
VATQVYVIILVALIDGFTLQLGYFFVNGLTADQRANTSTLKMCLEKCHDVGAEVVTMTLDGCVCVLWLKFWVVILKTQKI